MMSLRRWIARLNLAATVVLLGVIFIFVNFVASRRYVRTDISHTQLTALAEKTFQVLRSLDQPVQVIVFYQPDHRLYELIRDLLTEFEAASPRLDIDYVDPMQDVARARALVEQFDIDRPNLVVFASEGRQKHLSDTELAEYDYADMPMTGQPTLKAFTGEAAFVSAIISVTQARQPVVWVTTGHGEKALDDLDEGGLTELQNALERENLQVDAVNLLEQSAIPQETDLIIIPGPTRRFLEQELERLQTYLEHGGSVLALLDPLQETGLNAFLLRWGVTMGNDIVVDPAQQLPFISAANVFVTTYTQHPIVESMDMFMTLFPLARSVRPAQEPAADLVVTPLAMTSSAGWGETATESTTFQFDEAVDLNGPVSIAVAVQRVTDPTSRLVVIGDSDFAANSQIPNVGNADLLVGCVHWLVEQETLIGIGPKPIETIKLNLTRAQLQTISWIIFAGLPGLVILLGAGMWWRRRK